MDAAEKKKFVAVVAIALASALKVSVDQVTITGFSGAPLRRLMDLRVLATDVIVDYTVPYITFNDQDSDAKALASNTTASAYYFVAVVNGETS